MNVFTSLPRVIKAGLSTVILLALTSCELLSFRDYDVRASFLQDSLTIKRGESQIADIEIFGGSIDLERTDFYATFDSPYGGDREITLDLVSSKENWDCSQYAGLTCSYQGLHRDFSQVIRLEVSVSETAPLGNPKLKFTIKTGTTCLLPVPACTTGVEDFKTLPILIAE